MASIPLEVIVQDAEAPVVPNEDGTNNTETNITVPDTGTISSNGETSSSASSIILPAILLVLAIGSIVAVLIHKYHKRKKDKRSKKEKLAVVTSSIIAVLAATVLVGNLILPATKAATIDITDGIAPAEDKVSIIVTRDGGSAETSIESAATITSTSDFGYKVLLSMAEGVEAANLYLDGDTTSEHYIAATESAELTDNTWGYALTEDGEYSAVPLLANAATVAQGDEPVEDGALSIYYGVKVSNDLPAGTYSGEKIEYTLEPVPGFPDTLVYMQDMTPEICAAAPTPGNSVTDPVPTATLIDSRDNKTYTIAKLADGKCWMTQNLDLQKEDLLADVILDATNTDHPATGFLLPDSQISGGESWGDPSSQTDVETTHVYSIEADAGNPYRYCLEYRGSCAEWGDIIPSEKLGNLYNWYTATAGTGLYNTGTGEDYPYEANGSICPVNWRLSDNNNNYGTTELSTLFARYGVIESPVASNYISDNSLTIYEMPFLLVPTGYYKGALVDMGMQGFLWSSLADYKYGINGARLLGYRAGYLSTWDFNKKTSGGAVRCVAR